MLHEIDDLRAWISLKETGATGQVERFVLALCDTVDRLPRAPADGHLLTRTEIFQNIPNGESASDEAQRKRMRDAAKRAISFIVRGRQRRIDFAQARGRDTIVDLEPQTGGGSGNKAQIRLLLVDLSPPKLIEHSQDQEDEDAQDQTNHIIAVLDVLDDHEREPLLPVLGPDRFANAGLIFYHERPRADIRLTWRGYLYFGSREGPLPSWRQHLIIGHLLINGLLTAAPVLLSIISLMLASSPVNSRQIGTIMAAGLIAAAAYHLGVRPFMRLRSQRLVILDEDWLRYGQRPAVLEKIDDPDDPDGALLVVTRYEGVCSVCGSDVVLRNGGEAWPGRVVGICVNSPTEHVYTFDRFTLIGAPLRPGMIGRYEF